MLEGYSNVKSILLLNVCAYFIFRHQISSVSHSIMLRLPPVSCIYTVVLFSRCQLNATGMCMCSGFVVFFSHSLILFVFNFFPCLLVSLKYSLFCIIQFIELRFISINLDRSLWNMHVHSILDLVQENRFRLNEGITYASERARTQDDDEWTMKTKWNENQPYTIFSCHACHACHAKHACIYTHAKERQDEWCDATKT